MASSDDSDIDSDIYDLAHRDGSFRPPAEHIAGRAYVKRMERYKKEWLRFRQKCKCTVEDSDQPFRNPPNLNMVEAFLLHQARNKRGRLNEKISLRTLQKYWTEFRCEVKRQSGYDYPTKEVQDMDNMLAKRMRHQEGLSTKPRPKPLADGPVFQDILRYLWVYDEYEYQHPRMRIQLTLAILILHYLGLQPGELVESSAHRGSNEALWYKDLEVMAFPDENGRARFVVQPKIRNRKNRRDREDLEYVLRSPR